MAYTYTTVKALFTAICNAIRSKDGTVEEIDHQDIPDRISKIETSPEAALYVNDGKTRLLINTCSDAKYGFLIYSGSSNNEALIEWGDDTTDTAHGYGTLRCEHTYSSPGQYLITIERTDTSGADFYLLIYGTATSASSLDRYDLGYSGCIYAISAGTNISAMIENTALVKSIWYGRLIRCAYNALAEVEFIDDGNNSNINANHFRNTHIRRIDLPTAASEIGNQAFYECNNLTECIFPDTMTTIGTYGFYACKALDNVDLPSGVTSLPACVFYGCSSLKTMVLRSPTVVAIQTNTFNSTPIKNGTGTIYVPQALIAEYQAATNWSTIYSAGTQFLPIEGSQYEEV